MAESTSKRSRKAPRKRREPKPPPTLDETIREMMQFARACSTTTPTAKIDDPLERALDGEPEQLIDTVFKSIVAFDFRILLVAQMFALSDLGRWEHVYGYSNRPLPKSLEDEHLPRVVRIEDRLIDVMEKFARTRRIMALSRRGEETDVAEDTPTLRAVAEDADEAGKNAA